MNALIVPDFALYYDANNEVDVLPGLKAKQCPMLVVTGVNHDVSQMMPDHMH